MMGIRWNPRRERIAEMTGKDPGDVQYEMLVTSGLRAMLGDRNAKSLMERLKAANPGYFEQAMVEAETRFRALSEEERANPAKTLNQLVVTSAKLKARMAFGGGPRRALGAFAGGLKRLVWK
jgi:VIT1/CCC1 family predicted Fe2+/Mn2+ transporter